MVFLGTKHTIGFPRSNFPLERLIISGLDVEKKRVVLTALLLAGMSRTAEEFVHCSGGFLCLLVCLFFCIFVVDFRLIHLGSQENVSGSCPHFSSVWKTSRGKIPVTPVTPFLSHL